MWSLLSHRPLTEREKGALLRWVPVMAVVLAYDKYEDLKPRPESGGPYTWSEGWRALKRRHPVLYWGFWAWFLFAHIVD